MIEDASVIEDLSVMVGRTIMGATLVGGWPVLRLDDGTRIMWSTDWGDEVCVEVWSPERWRRGYNDCDERQGEPA